MVMYWINATGLSRGNRRILGEIVEGLSAMGLVERGVIALCPQAYAASGPR